MKKFPENPHKTRGAAPAPFPLPFSHASALARRLQKEAAGAGPGTCGCSAVSAAMPSSRSRCSSAARSPAAAMAAPGPPRSGSGTTQAPGPHEPRLRTAGRAVGDRWGQSGAVGAWPWGAAGCEGSPAAARLPLRVFVLSASVSGCFCPLKCSLRGEKGAVGWLLRPLLAPRRGFKATGGVRRGTEDSALPACCLEDGTAPPVRAHGRYWERAGNAGR